MLDYKFEGMIIARTAGELLEQLAVVADETIIKPEGGFWAGVSRFEMRTESFFDAFDRTMYEHDIYEPVKEGGELCFGLYKKSSMECVGFGDVSTAGELKTYLREQVDLNCKAVSVDDNFELEGSITEKIKFLLIRREEGLSLEMK